MTYQPQRFTAPDGTEMVVLRAEDFERLRLLAEDGEDVAEALAVEARIKTGEATVPGEVVKLMIEGGLSPLGAWRRYRGLSQAALAKAAGLSQVWVGRIEAGGGYGTPATRRKLAAALDAPVWALEDEEEKEMPIASGGKGKKYAPLAHHLCKMAKDVVSMHFAEVSDLVGGLPASATRHRAWWGNHEGNSQAKGWMSVGYLAEPDIKHRVVVFRTLHLKQ